MTAMVNKIEKYLEIPPNHRITIEIPPEVPVGEAFVKLTIEHKKRVNRVGELFGSGKGEIWMSDDFDAPLEDFKDYM